MLQGMERALNERRIDVVEFEYNRKWKATLRSARPMAPVIDWLYRRNYVCFWQGNKGALAQLSGACYREETRNRFGFARRPSSSHNRHQLRQSPLRSTKRGY